jgi:hypothetical protein
MALSDQFLVGNPTTFGTFTFTIQVSDAIGFSTKQAFNLVVTPAVTITTMLYASPVGAPLSVSMSATGGTAPYNWTVIRGSLPPGLTLSGAGLLAGTPTTSGSYSFSVRVTDSQLNSATAALNLVILQPLKITTTTLPSGSVGVNYGIQLTGTGGYSSYSWSLVSGSLPPSFSLTSGGNIYGVPSAPGTYNFEIQLTDGATAPVSQSFSIVIGQTAFSFTTSVLPRGIVNQTYFGGFAASGGTPPYTFSLASGSLPPGFQITNDSSYAQVAGFAAAMGSYTFAVRASDSASASSTRTFTIVITNGYAMRRGTQIPICWHLIIRIR